jgi:hypothetical protein
MSKDAGTIRNTIWGLFRPMQGCKSIEATSISETQIRQASKADNRIQTPSQKDARTI